MARAQRSQHVCLNNVEHQAGSFDGALHLFGVCADYLAEGMEVDDRVRLQTNLSWCLLRTGDYEGGVAAAEAGLALCTSSTTGSMALARARVHAVLLEHALHSADVSQGG